LHGDYISLVAKYSDVGRVPGYIWLTEIVGEENIIALAGGDRWFTDRRYGYYCDDRADNQSFRCSSSIFPHAFSPIMHSAKPAGQFLFVAAVRELAHQASEA
jgi:hypothetical protein